MNFDEFKRQLEENCEATSEKLNIIYNESDTRCWTAIVEPGNSNIFVTYHTNKGELGNRGFDIVSKRRTILMSPPSEVFGEITNIIN